MQWIAKIRSMFPPVPLFPSKKIELQKHTVLTSADLGIQLNSIIRISPKDASLKIQSTITVKEIIELIKQAESNALPNSQIDPFNVGSYIQSALDEKLSQSSFKIEIVHFPFQITKESEAQIINKMNSYISTINNEAFTQEALPAVGHINPQSLASFTKLYAAEQYIRSCIGLNKVSDQQIAIAHSMIYD